MKADSSSSSLPQQEEREAQKILEEKETDVSAGHAPKQKELERLVRVYSQRLEDIHSCLLGRYPNITTIESGIDATAWERESYRRAYEAATAFIESSVCDPDITNEMWVNHQEYKLQRLNLEKFLSENLNAANPHPITPNPDSSLLAATLSELKPEEALLEKLWVFFEQIRNTGCMSNSMKAWEKCLKSADNALALRDSSVCSPATSVESEKSEAYETTDICPHCGRVIVNHFPSPVSSVERK